MKAAKKNYHLIVLGKGETVVSVTERVITVKDITGRFYAYWYHFDEDGTPVIDNRNLMITTDDDIIRAESSCDDDPDDFPF